MKKIEIKRKLSGLMRSAGLPQDCVRGKALISMQGQEHICIENFKGIASYTEGEIRILTRAKKVSVSGKCLQIDCYTKDEIEISGCICKVEFL